MEEATVFERITAIDSLVLALMAERDLIGKRGRRCCQKRNAEGRSYARPMGSTSRPLRKLARYSRKSIKLSFLLSDERPMPRLSAMEEPRQ